MLWLMATRLGLMSGPFLGAVLYYFFNYQVTFYMMALIFLVALIPSAFVLPNENKVIKKDKLVGAKKLVLKR